VNVHPYSENRLLEGVYNCTSILVYLWNLAVELVLLSAAEFFQLALQQVAAEMAAGMAAKKEMVQETHLHLQAVVGKD
jgi:hypothetical protein